MNTYILVIHFSKHNHIFYYRKTLVQWKWSVVALENPKDGVLYKIMFLIVFEVASLYNLEYGTMITNNKN